MTLKELRTVIEQPAALPDVNLTFEGDLVGDLLFEVQGQAGALPLLQFTLDQLFRNRSGHVLTLRAYEEIDGVKGALAQYAESMYASLPAEEHRTLARFLFLRLVDPGTAEQEVTKRRAALTELSLPSPLHTLKLQEVMNTFIEARLLTTNTVAGISTVEVSHETLIFEWARFAEWLQISRGDIQLQQSISEDATEWIRRSRPVDRLYWGTKLTEAQEWAARNAPSSKEVEFLQASIAFFQSSLAERAQQDTRERAREEQERALHHRARRRQRYTVGIVGIMTVAMVVVIVVSLSIPRSVIVSNPGSAPFSKILCPTITTTSVEGIAGNCAFFISSGQLNPDSSQGIADQLEINLQNVSPPQPGKSYYAWLLPDRHPDTNKDQTGPRPIKAPLLISSNLTIQNGAVHFTYAGDGQNNNLISTTSRILITEENSGGTHTAPSSDRTAWRYYAELPQTQIPGGNPGSSALTHIRYLLYNDTNTSVLGLPGGLETWFFRNIEKVSELASSARDSWQGKNPSSVRSQIVRILGYLDGKAFIQQDVPRGIPLTVDEQRTSLSLLDIGELGNFNSHVPIRLAIRASLGYLLKAPDISQNQRNLASQILKVLDTIKPWLEKIHQDAKQLVGMSDAQLSSQNALFLLNDIDTQARYAYTGQNDPNVEAQRGATWIHNNIPFLATFELQRPSH